MQTILITGATSGIGFQLAKIYAGEKSRLILIGRKPLSELTDPLFNSDTYCQTDLADPNCHITIDNWLTDHKVDQINLVIHNAGIGWVGPTQEHPPAAIQEMIQVNLKAPIAITHRLFKRIESAGGKVVFVSSVVSQLPL